MLPREFRGGLDSGPHILILGSTRVIEEMGGSQDEQEREDRSNNRLSSTLIFKYQNWCLKALYIRKNIIDNQLKYP